MYFKKRTSRMYVKKDSLIPKKYDQNENADIFTDCLSGQIIKAHDGKIWAESDGPGKGSVFHIELPINQS